MNTIENHLQDNYNVVEKCLNNKEFLDNIKFASILMSNAINKGNKIITCGNGGSMCDAMHFAEEMTGRYKLNRQPLPAIAISDPAHLTCTGNDFGFDEVFSRFVEAFGKRGDILLAITTSGKSKNIINAIQKAKEAEMVSICLVSDRYHELAPDFNCDIKISVPDNKTDRVQEIHTIIVHSFIDYIEQRLLTSE